MTAPMGFVAVGEAVKMLTIEHQIPVYPWKEKVWYKQRMQDPGS
jgi:hypothetical protein